MVAADFRQWAVGLSRGFPLDRQVVNDRDRLFLAHGAAAIDAARSFTADGRDAASDPLRPVASKAADHQLEYITDSLNHLRTGAPPE